MLEDIVDTIMSAKIAWVFSFVNFTWKYKQVINNTDLDAA